MQRFANNYGRTQAAASALETPQSAHHAAPSKAGTAEDVGIVERLGTEATGALQALNALCQANHDFLVMWVKDIDPNFTEEDMNTFAEGSRVLVESLGLLGQVHPFIGAATEPFMLIMKLDSKRRDNERKVVAVKLQMQELMKALLELRSIQDHNYTGKDGITIAERLEDLIQNISKDVKRCGNAIDVYMKKSVLSRVMKSGGYESSFAEFASLFVEHRAKLQLRLQAHASVAINAIEQGVHTIEEKLDDGFRTMQEAMIAAFRNLDTPQEKELQKLIDDHGGAKECLNNEDALQELVRRSGEVSSHEISGRNMGKQSNDLQSMKKQLKKELAEDIDETFRRNMVPFGKKMDMQSKQLEHAVHSASDHIIQTLHSGAHDRICDADLRDLWKEMGWKGSVKARHFVLNLHDFYTDKLSRAKASNVPMIDHDSQAPPTPPLSANSTTATNSAGLDDNWALPYINAAYVQPILEAVDDDGTGFISIKEVNAFVESCPKGWRLPHWFAYWAVGWQASISWYKNRIYSVVQTLFQTLEDVLPSNRQAVDEYLFHPSFCGIELLLRSTQSVNSKITLDHDLAKITKMYSKDEEARIDANLGDVDYELDGPATVSLVTGEGRIERYVFPLIYLLLRRHLKVIKLSCKHVLAVEELVILTQSLGSVLQSVDSRIQQLEAIFKQTHLDVQARLGHFAFGMFQLSYGDTRRVPSLNTFRTWFDQSGIYTPVKEGFSFEAVDTEVSEGQLKILKHGTQDGFQPTEYFGSGSSEAGNISHPLQGTWTGRYSRFGDTVLKPVSCLLRLSFQISPDLQQITGTGEDYSRAFDFKGEYECDGTFYRFKFKIPNGERFLLTTCVGRLDIATNVITLRLSDSLKEYGPDAPPYQDFQLRQIPPSLLQFRYTDSQFAEDPVTSRWTFAYSAARHRAKEILWSRKHFQARSKDRRRFVELTIRSVIADQGWTPQTPLRPAEEDDLERLRRTLNPSEARFYQALAEFECRKLPLHPFIGCDSCSRGIIKSRMLCIQCMAIDLSDNIDLCSTCIDKSPAARGFSHDPSHDMVKVEETLHDLYFAQVVNDARAIVKRVKALLQSRKTIALPGKTTGEGKEESVRLACACCTNEVLTPFWACVVCKELTLICLVCDTQRRPPMHSPSHKLNHPLVRIHNTSTAGDALANTEDRVISLQQRLASLELNLASIDLKVEDRLSRLEHRVGLGFDTLEALLRKVGDQTVALLTT